MSNIGYSANGFGKLCILYIWYSDQSDARKPELEVARFLKNMNRELWFFCLFVKWGIGIGKWFLFHSFYDSFDCNSGSNSSKIPLGIGFAILRNRNRATSNVPSWRKRYEDAAVSRTLSRVLETAPSRGNSPNLSQPNPGSPPDGSPCTYAPFYQAKVRLG